MTRQAKCGGSRAFSCLKIEKKLSWLSPLCDQRRAKLWGFLAFIPVHAVVVVAVFTFGAVVVQIWAVLLTLHRHPCTPAAQPFLCFDSCPRAISMYSGSHRNDKTETCASTACYQPASPGTSMEIATNAPKLSWGAPCHLFALGICFSCTAWLGNLDLVSALPAEVQPSFRHNPGSCTCEALL